MAAHSSPSPTSPNVPDSSLPALNSSKAALPSPGAAGAKKSNGDKIADALLSLSSLSQPQEPAGVSKPRPGPRYDTHGLGMAPYMQQGVHRTSGGAAGKPAGGTTVPAGLPSPRPAKVQKLSPPPGIQTMSQQPSQPPNIPKIQTMSQQAEPARTPAAPPGIQTMSQAVQGTQGTLPAPRPLQGGNKAGPPSVGGVQGLMRAPPGQSRDSGGAQMNQLPLPQPSHRATGMHGPGAASELPPPQSTGASKQSGFISHRTQAAAVPQGPPGMQILQSGRPGPALAGPQVQTVAMHPESGSSRGAVQNGMVLMRNQGAVPVQLGGVPTVRPLHRPHGYR